VISRAVRAAALIVVASVMLVAVPNASAGPASATFSAKDFIDGWTAGGGIEVQFAPRWSLKGEYLYADLGRANHTFVFPGVPALNDSTHVTLNIVRAGVNLRF